MKKLKKIAVDTETTGLNPWIGCRPFMVQLLFEDTREGLCFEWDVDPFSREVKVNKKDLKELKDILNNPNYAKCFWNAKYDLFMLELIGCPLKFRNRKGQRLVEDVSWMARSVNNLEFSYELKALANKYLGFPKDDEQDLAESTKAGRLAVRKLGWKLAKGSVYGKTEWKADYWIARAIEKNNPEILKNKPKIKPNACATYGMADVDRTLDLALFYEHGMDEFNLWEAYDREMQGLPITMEMERKGVKCDVPEMRKARRECIKQKENALKRLQKASGNKEFNPNSPKQLVEFLYNGKPLKLKPRGFSKGGKSGIKQPSTAAKDLNTYFNISLVRDIFIYRTNEKACNTFFDKYSELMTPDNYLHPGYNQGGTLTWRYSCSNPNLQQVSSPESSSSASRDFLVDIRRVFIPEKDHVFFAPDYRQMEVVIFAAIYGVETMLDAIKAGEKIHEATANKLYGGKNNSHALEAALDVMKNSKKYTKPVNDKNAELLLKKYKYKITDLENELGAESYKKRAKSVTFAKIFGGGPSCVMQWLPNLSFGEAENVMDRFDDSFPEMAEKMDEIIYKGKKDGFIMTPYGVKLCVDRFYAYRIVNHIVQCSAGSQMKLGMIKCYNYIKSIGLDDVIRLALTVHDELIFEIHKKFLYKKVLKKLCSIMGDHEGRFNIKLPVDADIIRERWSKKEALTL